MGVAGIRIANAQEDGHFAFVPVLLQGTHCGVKPNLVIEFKDLFLSDTQLGSEVAIQTIGVRDNGI